MKSLRLNKILWYITFVLSLLVSAIGVFDIHIYTGIVSPDLFPGAFAQDFITLLASVIALVICFTAKQNSYKKHLVIFGLVGYLFYAYGIYVIERAYNMYYLVYMAIFALSFWGIIYGVSSLAEESRNSAFLGKKLRYISASGAMLQPVMFYPLWIAMLIPLMQSGNQIDSLYSIFILDLVFIMPAFFILSILTFKNTSFGIMLMPAIYILGFTLIFSLAVAEIVKPLFQMPIKMDALLQSLSLSVLFLVLGIVHLRKMKIRG